MEIIISSNTNKPIYEQITSQIKAMIMSGELRTGDPIPSMRALAKDFYQEEQQRLAEGHLQEAADIGRTSGISLGKLIELLTMFYHEEE